MIRNVSCAGAGQHEVAAAINAVKEPINWLNFDMPHSLQ